MGVIILFPPNISAKKLCSIFFQSKQEIELFQLRLGLKLLCPNSLIYPVVKDNGVYSYEVKRSPHAEDFYDSECIKYRKTGKLPCENIQERIVEYYFDSHNIFLLSDLHAKARKYTQNRTYLLYKCPHVQLYKFSFPIYFGNEVIGILFLGQFHIQDKQIKGFLWQHRQKPDTENVDRHHIYRREFTSVQNMIDFVEKEIIPYVFSLEQTIKLFVENKRHEWLKEIIGKQTLSIDSWLLKGLANSLRMKNPSNLIQNSFFNAVQESISSYMEYIETSSISLYFQENTTSWDTHVWKEKVTKISFTKTEFVKRSISIDYVQLNNKLQLDLQNEFVSTCNDENLWLYRCLCESQENKSDIVAYTARPPYFIFSICYLQSKNTLENRDKILLLLKDFFVEVMHAITYLSIILAENNTKTVLRIYRHEITHQLLALEKNNWFLEPKRLREINDHKLQHIAQDQLQCLKGLDYVTQNIDVITGKIFERMEHLHQEREIDVHKELYNRLENLYQKVKDEKKVWFFFQNNSDGTVPLLSSFPLLDIILFNLLSNAIKYSHPGSRIWFTYEDTVLHARPHCINITNYGIPIDTSDPEQVFQIYYRGAEASDCAEGSGIGLHVAKSIADAMGASIKWRCKKISQFNIPMVARFLSLPPEKQTTFNFDLKELGREKIRLMFSNKWESIINPSFLENSEKWGRNAFEHEMMEPTYEIIFSVEV